MKEVEYEWKNRLSPFVLKPYASAAPPDLLMPRLFASGMRLARNEFVTPWAL